MNNEHAALPTDILCAADYELRAKQHLDAASFHYIAGGSGDLLTLRDNLQAFLDIRIQHRLLSDCRHGHTETTLLGDNFVHPILLAPVAFQTLAHPDGELATARAADALDAGMVCSTLSSYTLEEIARRSHGKRWFQLYFQPRREHTLDLVRRAENAGYRALVVTLDSAIQAAGREARRAGFTTPPAAANLAAYPAPPQVTLNPGESIIFQGMMSEAPRRDDLRWLLDNTHLPVVVKGVMHPQDAMLLRSMGVTAQIVSNHGGRALDGVPGSLRALPALRREVGADYTLLLDGGIRSGLDVFKALASGADAVLIGRLQVYALATAGALGVAHLLKLLREELETCMALAGCPTLADINENALFGG